MMGIGQALKPRSHVAMAIVVLSLCFMFNMAGRGVGDTYIVFLLPLGQEFGWSRSEMSSVYSIYMLTTGLSAPFVGVLFDRWGPKVVYSCGLICLGIGYVLASKLSQLWQFYICVGVLGGIGVSALGMVPAASLVSRWFPSSTATAISIAYAGLGCGTLLIVPLAQYLNQIMGWRASYEMLGSALLLLFPLIFLLPWRLIRAGRPNDLKQFPELFVPTSGKSFGQAIRTRAFWSLAQLFFFTAVAMYAMIIQTIVYLMDNGLSPLEAASAFGMAGMLSVIGVTGTGFLADRIGYRRTAMVSFICTFLGVALLLALSYYHTRWLVIGFVVLFGIAQGARGPIVSSLCAKLFPGGSLATIYGAIYACMSIGAALGALGSGLLHDLSGGYRASFVLSMISVLLAAAPFWTSSALTKFEDS